MEASLLIGNFVAVKLMIQNGIALELLASQFAKGSNQPHYCHSKELNPFKE